MTDRPLIPQAGRQSQQAGKLKQEAARHRALAAELETPSTFAESTLHSRKAVACEKQAELLDRQLVSRTTPHAGNQAPALGLSPRLHLSLALQVALAASQLNTVLRACQYIATAVLVWRWWGLALTTVDPAATWPLTSWIMAPHASRFKGSGAISMLSWVTLSRWTGQTLCKAALL